MSDSNEVENGSDDDSLQKLKNKIDQESPDESETEQTHFDWENQDYLFPKKKKHKACNNDKQQLQQKQKIKKEKKKRANPSPKEGQDEIMKKFAELGLEPPPDMPEAFKICIQDMGGTDIKLVIQKFIRVSDLDP
ncbi:hypothetical protein V6N13_042516 [Hibiscus sabdariffa]